MPSTVNIGTLEGLLRWKADDAELNRSLDSVAKKADVSRSQLNKYNRELDSITSSYHRVVASLDPVAANTQKYERAEKSLTSALKAGIITQDQHNKVLAQAKEKYLSSSASTLTWREEMQRLTNVISPLSGRFGSLISTIDGLKDSLLGSSTAAKTAAGSVTAASTSFASLYAIALPLTAILATLAITAGSVYVGFKGFSFLKDAVVEGVKTQQIIERLNNTLQVTGSYAQVSSAYLVQLAESYELLTGKSKEEIIAAETILARFESLNKQSYPEALRATLAYSRAMGITAEVAASKLGPALEGNTRGLASLKEAGIVFTAAEKKVLTALVETGNVTEYQTKLFELLREKVGGVSDGYEKNLSKQVNRAKIILQDFGEAIANEVIPALEDVFSELIISLGGWDNLKKKVNEVGSAIGNFIRTYIYGLAIAYHELMAEMDILISRHRTMVMILSTPLRILTGKELIKSQKEAQKDAIDHAQAIIRLSNAYKEHRKALEGSEEVYRSSGTEIDNLIAKNQELARLTDELTDIYADQTLELQRIYALRMLATKGPFSREERLSEERKINEAHKDRILFLQQEEKFGKSIAESLAKQRKELKDLEQKARIELIFATKLEPIKISDIRIDTSKIKPIELSAEDLLSQQTIKDFEDRIKGVADSWKESFRTLKEITEKDMQDVEDAVRLGFLSVSEGEKAIARIRAEYYSAQIDQWSNFAGSISGMLSELGGSFGQVMAQIASAAQSIQGVNQTAQSLGGWSSAMGAFGGTVAAFVELYKFADAIIQKHKGEKYGTRASLDITGGIEGLSYFDHAGLELIHAMRGVLESLEDSLRISADDLDQIEIRVRNNGSAVQAWVKGQWIGTFTDVNTAIREALLTVISDPSSGISGLSALMEEGLKSWTSPDMEGLLDYLKVLRSISDLSLSPAVVQLQQTMLEFNRMREVLNKLDQSTQAVIDAQRDLTRAQMDAINQTKNALLGIDTSAAQAVRSLAGLDKGMSYVANSFVRGIQQSIDAAQKQLDKLNRNVVAGNRDDGGGGGGGSPHGTDDGGDNNPIARLFAGMVEDIDSEKARLERAIKEWQEQLAGIPRALTEQEIDLGVYTALEQELKKSGKHAELIAEMERERVKFKFEELRLELIAIGAWERWADIWQELYDQAKKDAGKPPSVGGRGGGGSSDKDNVRDFIKDKKFEISLVGLTEYQKSLAELDRQYDDLIKQAGNDKKLKGELLALKQKEIELLEKEKKLRTVDSFKEFVNPSNQFDKVRKTAADLIKDIKDSPFGDERKARMIGRVMDALDKQLTDLAKQAALGLFGSMLSDMERFGATEEQMRKAREMAAILEHEMKLASYALTIAELEAEGRLTEEQIATFHEMYDFLRGIDPKDFIGGGAPPTIANDNFSSYTSNAFEEFEDLLSRVQDKLAEWNRIPLSETLSKAYELTDSFSELMEDVNKLIPFGWNYTAIAQATFQKLIRNFVNDTLDEFEDSGNELEDTLREISERFTDINSAFIHLGATQEDLQRAELARLNAVNRALDQYLDPIRERRLSRLVGDRSILTGEQQYLNAQKLFRDMRSQIESGDLTNLGNVVTLADQYEDLLRSFTGGEGLRFGLKEIDDALASIENLVPGFAQEMAEIGTSDNPMIVEQQGMINAIEQNREAVNTGNTLMLGELRTGVSEMKEQTRRLDNIEVALSQPLQVRNVA